MPRVESVRYWRGRHETIPNDIISGRLLYEEDTGDVFLDYRDLETGELTRRQLTDTRKMNIAGGSFQGPVYLYQDPIDPNEAATKHYVDGLHQEFVDHRDDDARHLDVNKIFMIGNDSVTGEREYWNQKVNSVEGMGLSSNDFTDEYKDKLDSVNLDADDVNYTPVLTEGVELGRISINGQIYTIYSPFVRDINGNAQSATELKETHYFEGIPFNGTQDVLHYGSCSTDSTESTKYVQIQDFRPETGARILVHFVYDDDPSGTGELHLKVNDEEPALITFRDDAISRGKLKAGLHEFVYHGTEYKLAYGVDYDIATENSDGLMSSTIFNTIEDLNAKVESLVSGGGGYVLPPANELELGGVIVGENISVDPSGTISLSKQDIIDALGFVPIQEINNETITQLISTFKGATQSTAGKAGLVPAPPIGGQDYYLKGDGTWVNSSKIGGIFEGATATTDGTSGMVPNPLAGEQDKFLRGDGNWVSIEGYEPGGGGEVSVDVMVGATSTEDGESGTVPQPKAGQQNTFLRGDGTWIYPVASDEDFKAYMGL